MKTYKLKNIAEKAYETASLRLKEQGIDYLEEHELKLMYVGCVVGVETVMRLAREAVEAKREEKKQ